MLSGHFPIKKSSQKRGRHLFGTTNFIWKWEAGRPPSIFALYSSKAVDCDALPFNVVASMESVPNCSIIEKIEYDHRMTEVDFHLIFYYLSVS